MKFLAILKDSIREAFDAKIFFVMIGLSVLTTLIAATIQFKPAAGGGDNVLKLASFALSVDTSNIDLSRGNQENLAQSIMQRIGQKGLYQVVSIAPVDGAPDDPSSQFRVRVQAMLTQQLSPEEVERHVRDTFGIFKGLRLAEVREVHLVPESGGEEGAKAATYDLIVQPTRQARPLWNYHFSLFFGALPFGDSSVPLGLQLWIIEDQVVCGFGAWVGVLVGVILTAFFIPNMLRKGTIDLLIVKPIHRTTLLVYKYIGGLTFIFVNTAVSILGIWLTLSLLSGIWAPAVLLTIPVITLYFAVLYAFSTLFAVLTRSAVVAILISCLVWFGLVAVGYCYVFIEERRARDRDQEKMEQLSEAIDARSRKEGSEKSETKTSRPPSRSRSTDTPVYDNWFGKTVTILHGGLPRTKDLDMLTSRLLLNSLMFSGEMKSEDLGVLSSFSWGESLSICGVYIALLVGLSCWRFSYQDF
jgi:hypothetical protein